jgi:hypothetical protein
MRPNLATPGLLVQPVCSDCGLRLLARVRQRVTWVDLLTPSISSGLRCLTDADPATWWDVLGNPKVVDRQQRACSARMYVTKILSEDGGRNERL